MADTPGRSSASKTEPGRTPRFKLGACEEAQRSALGMRVRCRSAFSWSLTAALSSSSNSFSAPRLQANAGLVSNVEVREILQTRLFAEKPAGSSASHTRGAANAPQDLSVGLAAIEEKVLEFLNTTPAGLQTREIAGSFLEAAAGLALSKAELMQALNLRPALPVEAHLILDSCDQRLGEEGVGRLLGLVELLLPKQETPEQED